MRRLKVAVVGSGPSAAYCTQLLCEDETVDARVDVYEQLPAPYGLVRYGVAPDHPKIKSVAASFAEIYGDPRVRFAGNVSIGTGVPLSALRDHYDAVILAYGASVDRRLGIEGEDLSGVFSATDFVSWYSGHPDAAVDRFALSAERAVIIGVGNVALDVARMLVLTPDELRRTDVPQHVLDVLSESAVRDIDVVGRRAPRFAKFTPKELAELGGYEGADVFVAPADLERDAARYGECTDPSTRRLLATFERFAARLPADRARRIHFRFGLRPSRIIGSQVVRSVRFDQSDEASGAAAADLEAQLVLRSVGYQGTPVAGVPFDEETGTIPNAGGRVLDGNDTVEGLYAVGWIKRGPTGVIGTNRQDAMETVGALLADVHSGGCRPASATGDLIENLREQGMLVVGWDGWRHIEQAELELGSQLGRGPVKLHDRGDLLRAAAS